MSTTRPTPSMRRAAPGRPLARTAALALLMTLASSPAGAQLSLDPRLTPRPGASDAPAGAIGTGTVEARLARLERMLGEQTLSDLVLQLQRLQQEVQDLRGQVEMQQFAIGQLQSGPRFGSAPRAVEPPPGADAVGAAGGTVPPAGAGGETGTPLLPIAPPPQQGLGSEGRGGGSGGGMLGLPAPETTEGVGASEREGYLEAFDLLKARDYAAARTAFDALRVRYPQGQFADSACYWLGEIGYVTQDYPAAMAQFNRLITEYPLSAKVPAAMLKLGYIYADQNDTEKARALFQEVMTRFPDTTEARLAQGRLGRAD